MPVGVVVGLEVVEVEHPERDRRALALGALELTRELLVERAPVADPVSASTRVSFSSSDSVAVRWIATAASPDSSSISWSSRSGDLRRLAAPQHGQHAHDLSAGRQRLEGAGAPLRQPEALGARAVLALAAVERDAGARAVPRRQLGPGDAEADVDGGEQHPARDRGPQHRGVRAGQLAGRGAQLGLELGGVRDAREPARHLAEPAQHRRLVGAFALAAGSSTCAVTAAASTRRVSRSSSVGVCGCSPATQACRSAARRRSPAPRRRSRGPWRCRRSAGRAVVSGTTSGSSPATACAQKESARGAWSPLPIPKPAFVHWRSASTRLNAAIGAPSRRAVSATSSSKAGSGGVSSRAVLRSAARRWGSVAGKGRTP